MTQPLSVTGWDIGGANIKAVRLDRAKDGRETWKSASLPFPMWKDADRLEAALSLMGEELGAAPDSPLALTMTAELADVFRTKREGVAFVCEAVKRTFPRARILALDLSTGGWSPIEAAEDRPLDFAANNWLASALYLAPRHADVLFMDVGSTTTDIIPLKDGAVLARGRTDMDRLTSGELVYTGVLRTNPNTLAPFIPVRGLPCRTAAEWFASMADVHLLLGRITAAEYSCPTADGAGVSPEECARRLARVVCADSEMLRPFEISGMARSLYERQLGRIAEALHQVLSAREDEGMPTLLAAGGGAFLVRDLGARLGLPTADPLPSPDPEALAVFPALAAASLLADHIGKTSP